MCTSADEVNLLRARNWHTNISHEKAEVTTKLGIPRRRWKDNIKIGLNIRDCVKQRSLGSRNLMSGHCEHSKKNVSI